MVNQQEVRLALGANAVNSAHNKPHILPGILICAGTQARQRVTHYQQDLLAPLCLQLAHQFNHRVGVRVPIEQVNRALNNGEVRNFYPVVALIGLQAAANRGG
jgi:hypothetical protein